MLLIRSNELERLNFNLLSSSFWKIIKRTSKGHQKDNSGLDTKFQNKSYRPSYVRILQTVLCYFTNSPLIKFYKQSYVILHTVLCSCGFPLLGTLYDRILLLSFACWNRFKSSGRVSTCGDRLNRRGSTKVPWNYDIIRQTYLSAGL